MVGLKHAGAHVSAAGGVHQAPLRALEIGATAFALFTKNRKRWDAAPLSRPDISRFRENLRKAGIDKRFVLPHDGYLINLAHSDTEKWERSLLAFIDEAKRTAALGLSLLNFHPGAHLGLADEAAAIGKAAKALDRACDAVENVIFVAETTAGQGTSIGYRFEHLRDLKGEVKYPERLGVCIDTCHIFAAGYDIRTEETYGETMKSFDSVIGFAALKGMHINDAKSDFGSRVDRHASLGEGKIGWKPFYMMMEDERLDEIPCILETPDPERWAEEIKILQGVQHHGM